jgi:hypothetical protein
VIFSPESIIVFLNSLPPELVEGFLLLACAGTILTLLYFFGALGLSVYIPLAVVISNIQALKAVQFSFFSTPIALGTVVFTSTFLTSDILTEFYGKKVAQKAVWLGFSAALIVTVFMILTLGSTPLNIDVSSHARFLKSHQAITTLFIPAPALFTASLFSYLISQYSDIWIYQTLKKITHEKWIWLRANASMMISALLDNIIFSTLAWYVFAPEPLDIKTLVFTYILGTYIIRLVVSLANTPILYACQYIMQRKNI